MHNITVLISLTYSPGDFVYLKDWHVPEISQSTPYSVSNRPILLIRQERVDVLLSLGRSSPFPFISEKFLSLRTRRLPWMSFSSRGDMLLHHFFFDTMVFLSPNQSFFLRPGHRLLALMSVFLPSDHHAPYRLALSLRKKSFEARRLVLPLLRGPCGR